MIDTLISVILPIYNVESYLRRCINSILLQTYPNLEIILVDDGSPDSCGAICDEYAKMDARIHAYHKPNGGVSDARNYGVAQSTGAYIAFIDPDDYVSPNYIEYLLSLITTNDADIACCRLVQTHQDTVDYYSDPSNPAALILTGKQACAELFGPLYSTLVVPHCKLYKRNIVEKYPFPVGRIHEDEAILCKYLYASQQIVIGNQHLYAYYQRPGSITHPDSTAYKPDAAWAFEHRAQFFEENNEIALAKISWSRLFYYYIYHSRTNNGQCDNILKTFSQGKHLSLRIRFKLKLYNTSPKLYEKYLNINDFIKGLIHK